MKITDKQFDRIAIIIALFMLVGLLFWIELPDDSLTATGYQNPIVASSSKCTSVGGLPDSKCTPGALNPDINQNNIKQNICNKNWSTKSIRPPSSYTTKLKAQQMVEYNLSGHLGDYEEDHLISLQLGGSPRDPKNLWPEVYAGEYGAREKDRVENILHLMVCEGTLTLKQAQNIVSIDWRLYSQIMPATMGSFPKDYSDEDDN